MWRDFEGGVYWDELADRCGDISRAVGFRGAARFRGNTVSLLVDNNIIVKRHFHAQVLHVCILLVYINYNNIVRVIKFSNCVIEFELLQLDHQGFILRPDLML